MIIDAHMHVNFKGFEASGIIEYLDKYGIDLCWLLTWEENNPAIPQNYIHLSIEDVFDAYEKYPSRIVPMYAPDPVAHDFEDKMIFWHKNGIKGCGELKVSLSWNSEEITRLLNCINGLNIPLVFHMEASRDYYIPNSTLWEQFLGHLFSLSMVHEQPAQVVNLIARIFPPLKSKRSKMLIHFPGYLLDFINLRKRLSQFPNVIFIGHGPLFWKGISADWEYNPSFYSKTLIKEEGVICDLLSKHDNLYADISGRSGYNALSRDKKFSKQFLIRFGHKLLYGTDNFEYNLIELLNSFALPKEIYDRIYFENAVKLIN